MSVGFARDGTLGGGLYFDVSGCVCRGMRAGSVAAVGCGFGGGSAGLCMSGHARAGEMVLAVRERERFWRVAYVGAYVT